MLQERVCQVQTKESQIEPEIPAWDWFTEHCRRTTSTACPSFTSKTGLATFRQKSHRLLTNQLSGKMSFLIPWSSSAWAVRGVLLCRWTPSCPSFHVFLVAASSVKAVSLCFCMPKSPENTMKRYESALFFPSVLSKCSHLH